MDPVAIELLLSQLRESVSRLAASAEPQWDWILANNYPVGELLGDFELAWPMFGERLGNAGLIDEVDEKHLNRLLAYIDEIYNPDHEQVFTEYGLENALEWKMVKRLADDILLSLGTHGTQSGDA